MSSLSTYLAKKYLTASGSSVSEISTRPKKRRRKEERSSDTGLMIIADDDEDLSLSKNRSTEKDEDTAPILDANFRSAEFRRAKKDNWKPIGAPAPAPAPADADKAAADRILAEAAEDRDAQQRQAEGEGAPAIVGETEDVEPEPGPVPQKPRGGLQTAEETARLEAAAQARRGADARASKSMRKAEAEETVYRDATGRRIDISMKRAEARAAEEEERRQERREKEDAMGEVQRRERAERKQAVEDAKFLGVARYADDEGLNEEMKEVGRWGDPMLGYVNENRLDRTQGDDRNDKTTSTAVRGQRRKEYQGAAAPNRYGIRPGWRWDGVDRGNGFEKEWFQARGRKSRNENLQYQWQMDE